MSTPQSSKIDDYHETPVRFLGHQESTPGAKKSYLRTAPWSRNEAMRYLPVHSTPPSSMFKIRNPFDKALLERLHLPVCSPNVFSCSNVIKNESDSFEWTIEDISELNPANIETNGSQYNQKLDPVIENMAQKKIEAFFMKHHIVPSPMEAIKRLPVLLEHGLPTTVPEKRDGYAQTELSLPPTLPIDVENALKSFYTYTENQQQHVLNSQADYESRDASLRRKLFSLDESDDSYIEQPMDYVALSPALKSPALSLAHQQHLRRNYGSPTENIPLHCTLHSNDKYNESIMKSPALSPISKKNKDHIFDDSCNISPLCQSTPEKKILYRSRPIPSPNNSRIAYTPDALQKSQHIKLLNNLSPSKSNWINISSSMTSRNKSATKLDFSGEDMSIDLQNSCKSPENDISLNLNETSETILQQSMLDSGSNEKENGQCESYVIQTSPHTTPLRSRLASAKNLSISFSMSEYFVQDELEPSTKSDSGFTETFNSLSGNSCSIPKNLIKNNAKVRLKPKYICNIRVCSNCSTKSIKRASDNLNFICNACGKFNDN